MKSNKIYKSVIGECESLEHRGAYKGNGHHLAQRLTTMVLIGLLPKTQKRIYDALTMDYETTKTISEKTGLSTKFISSCMKQINSGGDLVMIDNSNKPFKYKKSYNYETV